MINGPVFSGPFSFGPNGYLKLTAVASKCPEMHKFDPRGMGCEKDTGRGGTFGTWRMWWPD